MTPRKASLFGSFLFIDRPHGYSLRPAEQTSRDKNANLQIEMTVTTIGGKMRYA
jgi:hypothetical protein